jgi:hypothetical protein
MLDDLQQLEEDYKNLTQAIRMGITTIVAGGQTTVFASIPNMQRVASQLEAQIAECKGETPRKPRVSSINLSRGV